MDIILLNDVDHVGDKFEIVTVKNGYARNFLIPQKLALIANDTNLRRLADFRKRESAKLSKMLGHFQEVATNLKTVTLKIGAKAGTSGKIFGSVTTVQIAAALLEQAGVEVERRKIKIDGDVKEVGDYTAQLHMHPEVDCSVKFSVVAE